MLLIGIALGYIIKGRSTVKTDESYYSRYPSGYSAPAAPAQDETKPAAPEDSARDAAEKRPRPAGSGAAAENFELPVRLPAAQTYDESAYADDKPASRNEETVPEAAEEPVKKPANRALRGAEKDFFRDPGRFSGKDLELELQMIMARKTPNGWLINLVHSESGKSADYLYVEDDSVLGVNPDLKIGYFYRVRFSCRKGDSAGGNKLLELTPTGNKADWATGVSAIE
jgi:hypothetical protein